MMTAVGAETRERHRSLRCLMKRAPTVAAMLVAAGCAVGQGLSVDGGNGRYDGHDRSVELRDQAARDRSPEFDQAPRLDQVSRPDQMPQLDQRASITPIPALTLGTALNNERVPCVLQDGRSDGSTHTVADSPEVSLVDGKVTLAGASQTTVEWVGGLPSVTVVWDPNACDPDENPGSLKDWEAGGLLIRGATLNSFEELVLQPGRTPQDINVLDVGFDGACEKDFFGADDSALTPTAWPHMANPLTRAKEIVIELGTR